jgi:monofunctional biosynthetic peptidoglycan transglycosylase
VPPETGLRRAGSWIRAHKLKAVLLLLAGLVLAELLTIPWFSIGSLRTENPGTTSLMRQRLGEAEKSGKSLKIVQQWIPLARIPPYVVDAVVVAEDGTFFEHGGIDWFEVQESIEKNIEEGRAARGASTITQQLAKNLYLSTSKDPVRKLKEVIITLLLERTLSKRRILEIYMNIIEWGRGIFGIEAAARTFFGKSAAALTLEEGARLAAVIPSPLRHRPDADTRYVLRRKGIVLARMAARSRIPETSTEEDQPQQAPQTDTLSEQRPAVIPGDTAVMKAIQPPAVVPDDTTATNQENGDGLQGRQPPH